MDCRDLPRASIDFPDGHHPPGEPAAARSHARAALPEPGAQREAQLFSGSLFPAFFFGGGQPTKLVFPKRAPFFFQGRWTTEEVSASPPAFALLEIRVPGVQDFVTFWEKGCKWQTESVKFLFLCLFPLFGSEPYFQ